MSSGLYEVSRLYKGLSGFRASTRSRCCQYPGIAPQRSIIRSMTANTGTMSSLIRAVICASWPESPPAPPLCATWTQWFAMVSGSSSFQIQSRASLPACLICWCLRLMPSQNFSSCSPRMSAATGSVMAADALRTSSRTSSCCHSSLPCLINVRGICARSILLIVRFIAHISFCLRCVRESEASRARFAVSFRSRRTSSSPVHGGSLSPLSWCCLLGSPFSFQIWAADVFLRARFLPFEYFVTVTWSATRSAFA